MILGEVCREQKDLNCALDHFKEARDLARSINLKAVEAGALAGLGNIYREQGKQGKKQGEG